MCFLHVARYMNSQDTLVVQVKVIGTVYFDTEKERWETSL